MAGINLLDDNTINKIAAGEVVEKPAAVIKELVENSIDAGGNAITVEIKNGGLDMMRITDNGRGIAPDDIKLAFCRHATSKIRDIDDLSSLSSLGFRGEALASIAAVSRTECVTKVDASITGVRYEIEGGVEKSCQEVGCPNGTTFVVRDIFYNTPARRKFLKTPATEGSYTSELVSKIALSHPEVAFRFIANGQLKLNTSGNGNLRDVIYRIYGKDITDNVIRVENEANNINVSGYIGKPVVSRGNRGMISCFVNGRYIKSPILFKAVEEGYNGYMMQHKFPFAVLMIDIDPGSMDVNVHPSKQEIRFSDSDVVYSTICNTIKETLKKSIFVEETAIPDAPGNMSGQHKGNALRKELPARNGAASPAPGYITHSAAGTPVRSSEALDVIKSVSMSVNEKREKGPEPFEVKRRETVNDASAEYQPTSKPVQPSLFEHKDMRDEQKKDFRIAGCVFSTYWIVEYHDEMYIMDQHAAHEKVLYERLCEKVKIGAIASQGLFPPVILTLTPAEAHIVNGHAEELSKMGFAVEEFGGNEYKVSSVPADLPGIGSKSVLMDWISMLVDESTLKSTETAFMERLATMSCKAAVKGGRHITETEACSLVKQLFELENPFHCPHGRPTMIKMTKYELEKRFGRVL